MILGDKKRMDCGTSKKKFNSKSKEKSGNVHHANDSDDENDDTDSDDTEGREVVEYEIQILVPVVVEIYD